MPSLGAVKRGGLSVQKRTNRTFFLLLGGSSVSMLGSRVTMIAFPMITLYLTGSPVAAGWVAFAATAPSILFYIPAGALVDLMDPKRVMLLSEFGRGVAISGVVAMVALGWKCIFWYVVAAIAEETLEVFSNLAERCYVGSLVERDEASPALARVEARTHVVVLVGRPLGGLLFEMWPIAPFFFDVMTFIVSVGALLGIKRQHAGQASFIPQGNGLGRKGWFSRAITRQSQPPEWHIATNISEGWCWLRRDRFARSAMVLLASTTLIIQALIMVFIAEAHTQRLSSIVVGIVLAMSGLGGALGSAFASRLRALFSLFKDSWIQVQMLGWSVALIVLAMSGGRSPVYTEITMAILGFMGAVSNIELDTYLIKQVPGNMLARVTSIGRLMSFAACAIGPLIGGFLFEEYGVQETVLWLMTATISLAAYSVLAPSMRTCKSLSQQASILDMILGWQLGHLAACMDAMNVWRGDGGSRCRAPLSWFSGRTPGKLLAEPLRAQCAAEQLLSPEKSSQPVLAASAPSAAIPQSACSPR